MAAKAERTNTPGIYRRHQGGCWRQGRCECAYVVRYRARGRLLMETFSTFADAREGKRTRERAAAAGEFSAP